MLPCIVAKKQLQYPVTVSMMTGIAKRGRHRIVCAEQARLHFNGQHF
jgi:hypothetical protein